VGANLRKEGGKKNMAPYIVKNTPSIHTSFVWGGKEERSFCRRGGRGREGVSNGERKSLRYGWEGGRNLEFSPEAGVCCKTTRWEVDNFRRGEERGKEGCLFSREGREEGKGRGGPCCRLILGGERKEGSEEKKGRDGSLPIKEIFLENSSAEKGDGAVYFSKEKKEGKKGGETCLRRDWGSFVCRAR